MNSNEDWDTGFAEKERDGQSEEARFLSDYRMEDFDRPSVTTDIAAFTIRSEAESSYRHDPEQRLALLLIRRGEHPFRNCWALPGGFLKMDETLEECALREIREETGVTPNALMPIGVFSDVDRDPRGRIISHGFLSVISQEAIQTRGGSDAIDAKWFDLRVTEQDGRVEMELASGQTSLKVRLRRVRTRFGRGEYEILESGGLAFDHGKIILGALDALRRDVGDYQGIFDFLPEKFTLTELQRVQEIILNVTLLPANFRRKIASMVEETEEFSGGAGHRPSRLYRRKM